MKIDRVEGYIIAFSGVGTRVSYNYCTLDSDEDTKEAQKRGEFQLMDDDVQEHVDAIKKYIEAKKLNRYENN